MVLAEAPAGAGSGRCIDLSLDVEGRELPGSTLRRRVREADGPGDRIHDIVGQRSGNDAGCAGRGPVPVGRSPAPARASPCSAGPGPDAVGRPAGRHCRASRHLPGGNWRCRRTRVGPGRAGRCHAGGPLTRPAPTTLPSRTAAARERALVTLGCAASLRGELASNNLDTIEPLLRAALDSAGLASSDALDPALLEAAMRAAMEGYRAETSGMLGYRPGYATGGQTAPGSPASSRQPAPAPAVPAVETSLRPAVATATSLSPTRQFLVICEAFRKTKKVNRVWQDRAERDAETKIRMSEEFFGDLPSATSCAISFGRTEASCPRSAPIGSAAAYTGSSDLRGNRRVNANEVLRVSRCGELPRCQDCTRGIPSVEAPADLRLDQIGLMVPAQRRAKDHFRSPRSPGSLGRSRPGLSPVTSAPRRGRRCFPFTTSPRPRRARTTSFDIS